MLLPTSTTLHATVTCYFTGPKLTIWIIIIYLIYTSVLSEISFECWSFTCNGFLRFKKMSYILSSYNIAILICS